MWKRKNKKTPYPDSPQNLKAPNSRLYFPVPQNFLKLIKSLKGFAWQATGWDIELGIISMPNMTWPNDLNVKQDPERSNFQSKGKELNLYLHQYPLELVMERGKPL